MLVFPRLVQQGKIPNVDFLHLYGPGSLDVLALWYWVFGYTLEAQRTFGLLQHLGIIFAIYALTRAWGRVSAVGAACSTALLILTPIGLSALAWHGAVALALWAIVFAIRATQTGRTSNWVVAGLLAGLALTFRPDIVLAVGFALLFAVLDTAQDGMEAVDRRAGRRAAADVGPPRRRRADRRLRGHLPRSGRAPAGWPRTSPPAVVGRRRRSPPGRRRRVATVVGSAGSESITAAVPVVLHRRDRGDRRAR